MSRAGADLLRTARPDDRGDAMFLGHNAVEYEKAVRVPDPLTAA